MTLVRCAELWAVSFIAVVCLFCAKPERIPRPQQAREYAVYDAALEAMFFDPAWRDRFAQVRPGVVLEFVIARQTSLGRPPVLASVNLGSDQAHQKLAPVPKGLFEQLLKDNETSIALEDQFTLSAPVTFLGEDDIESLDAEAPEHGWDHFWFQHPQAQGFLMLSRVTFDQNGKTALVYAANGLENLHAGGYLILLNQVRGRWSVVRAASLWIS